MTKVALLAGGEPAKLPNDFDIYVGIDRGSLRLLEQGLPLDLAIGDFDSVTQAEFASITSQAQKLITAPREKNDTDTGLAVKAVFEHYPQAEITIFGAFGGRLDHLMSNIFLPSNPDIAPYMQQIILADSQNQVSFRPAGCHQIYQLAGMTYIAFMTSDDADLRIKGAKYELTEDNFFKRKIYSSNEFADKPIEVAVSTGYVIIIQTKDGR
ncbi:thiamine diphosphokinase [Streptococcus dentapri]|uniref:Thiamine diphosphokinase n=1 Tax=Streptococcus dentapri TaxID=573564 RepID=A0ABV8D056_9STRE